MAIILYYTFFVSCLQHPCSQYLSLSPSSTQLSLLVSVNHIWWRLPRVVHESAATAGERDTRATCSTSYHWLLPSRRWVVGGVCYANHSQWINNWKSLRNNEEPVKCRWINYTWLSRWDNQNEAQETDVAGTTRAGYSTANIEQCVYTAWVKSNTFVSYLAPRSTPKTSLHISANDEIEQQTRHQKSMRKGNSEWK